MGSLSVRWERTHTGCNVGGREEKRGRSKSHVENTVSSYMLYQMEEQYIRWNSRQKQKVMQGKGWGL